jgi:hypothetical protein
MDSTATELIEQAEILDNLPLKQQAYGILRDAGLKNGQAVKVLGITDARGTQISQRLKKHLITGNTKLLKTASQTIHALAAGKKVGDIEHVKDSTVGNIAMYVMDHWDAVQKATDAPTTSTYTQVNINITNNGVSSGMPTASDEVNDGR